MATTVEHYSSLDVRPYTDPQLQTSEPFQFPNQYAAPPRISPGISQLDIDHSAGIRVRTYASDTSAKGTVIHSDSWANTINYSVNVNWFVFPPAALEFQSGKFSTQEDHPWDKPQPETSRRINFAYPFVTPPKVISFISELDMGNDANFRAKTYVTDIDTNGFTIHLDTWGDTKLYSLEAQWVAYPEDRPNTFSTTFNTQDVRPWQNPQLETNKTINFGGLQFHHQPKVFVAFNELDIDKKANLRLRTYVDEVTTTGAKWHVDGWADTVVYSGGGVLLAFN